MSHDAATVSREQYSDESSCRYVGLSTQELVLKLQSEVPHLILPSFSLAVAIAMGQAVQEIFKNTQRYHQQGTSGIAYSITLFSGVVLCAGTAGVGVVPDNMEWLKRKSNTVRRFGTSSWLRGQTRLLKGRPADDPLLGDEYAAHGGAIPINVKNVATGPIGALAVSGLTQELDHELAIQVVGRFA